jgi:hypothetical protein
MPSLIEGPQSQMCVGSLIRRFNKPELFMAEARGRPPVDLPSQSFLKAIASQPFPTNSDAIAFSSFDR